jgi:hypothetical protein
VNAAHLSRGQSPNQSLHLPGRPSRGAAWPARSAAFGGTSLATVVSFLLWRVVVAAGPQLSSIRSAASPALQPNCGHPKNDE